MKEKKKKKTTLYSPLIQVAFPLLIIHIKFLLAIPRLVQFAADESDDEFPLLVHDVLAAAGLDVDAVRVEERLGHEGELGQDGRVPLDHVFLTSRRKDVSGRGTKKDPVRKRLWGWDEKRRERNRRKKKEEEEEEGVPERGLRLFENYSCDRAGRTTCLGRTWPTRPAVSQSYPDIDPLHLA